MWKNIFIITVCSFLSSNVLSAQARKISIVRPTIPQTSFNPMASYLEPESVARAHIAQIRTGKAVFSPFASFELNDGSQDLTIKKLLENRHSNHVTFQQELEQLPIFGQQLRVHMDRNMTVLLLNGSYVEQADFEVHNIVIIKPQKAIEIAESTLGQAQLFQTSTVTEGFAAVGEKLLRAYFVTVFAAAPLGEFVYIITADTGEIIRSYNRILDLPDNKPIYKNQEQKTAQTPNWLKTRENMLALVTEPEPLQAATYGWIHEPSMFLYPALRAVALAPTNSDELQNSVLDVFSAGQTRAKSKDKVFTYRPTDYRYQEVMVYYYINAAHTWLNNLDIPINIENLEAVIGYSPADNSFYSPSSHGIYFGTGGIPDAEDAQIILHEFGHAIIHALAAIEGSPDSMSGAMHEGFADYLAATWFNEPNIAAWDSLAYSEKGYLRTLNNNLRFPDDMQGNCHHDGQIWGGTLWDLRTELNKEKADQLVFHSLQFLPENCEFTDGLQAILSADESLFGSKNRSSIIKVFLKRGIRLPKVAQEKFDQLYTK